MLDRIKTSEIYDVFRLYRYVHAHYPSTALLESLGTIDDVSRYSMIGVIAKEQIYEQNGSFYCKIFADGSTEIVSDWLKLLNEWCGPLGQSSSPLQTGAIGYIGYEMHRYFEFVPNSDKLLCPLSKICLTKYALIYIFDRLTFKAYWISDENMDDEIAKIEVEFPKYIPTNELFYTLGDTEKDFTRESYLDAIRKCIHHIQIGDMLQANITMRFHGRYFGNPISLYEELRKITPNPFFAYLDFSDTLISTSPESFLHISQNTIMSRPIKGTVRTEIAGKDQIDFLEQNSKNCSENIMITDLVRNDIGRVCEVGTVQVPVLCGTRKFNQIYHLETIVQGTLKNNVMLSDVLASNFPGGSITGAPKVKAMEIIDTLEFTERGPYCGAIGFWGSHGYVSSSIGIRIVYFHDDKYFLHAGGGIVVKSNPQEEYEELLLKIESLLNTLDRFNVLRPQREELDKITSEIFRLVGRRISVIKEVQNLKKQYAIPVLQAHRMDSILAAIMKQNEDEGLSIPEDYIKNLLKVIFNETMKIEEDD